MLESIASAPGMLGQIRVILADDHPIVRAGLRWALLAYPRIEVVGEAGDGLEALKLVVDVGADVLLLDLNMPHMDGRGVLDILKRWSSGSRTVVLTEDDCELASRESMLLGAAGVLPKSASVEEIVEALHCVHSGGLWLPRPKRSPARARTEPTVELTAREREVVRMVAQGLSNSEIGAAMQIHKHTVSNHLCTILRKLGLKDRFALSLSALQDGIHKQEDSIGERSPTARAWDLGAILADRLAGIEQ